MTDGSWLRVVCRLGEEAATRRYVVCGREGFRCAKVYDAEMAREARTIVARGDNCDGVEGDLAQHAGEASLRTQQRSEPVGTAPVASSMKPKPAHRRAQFARVTVATPPAFERRP